MAATDAYLRATLTDRDAIIGRSIFDLLPADRAGQHADVLRASLDRVRQHLASDTMPVQHSAIGASSARAWRSINTPVLGPRRELLSIIHRIEAIPASDDHAASMQPTPPAASPTHGAADYERLYALLMQLPPAIAMVRGPDLLIELANPRMRQLVAGDRTIEGRPLSDAIPHLTPMLPVIARQVYRSGTPFVGEEFPVSHDWDGSGLITEKIFSFLCLPLFDDQQHVDGVIVYADDVTAQTIDRRTAQRRLAILTAVIDSMPDAVYIGDEHGITMCNDEALAMLGFETRAELNRNIEVLANQIETRVASTGQRMPPDQEAFAVALSGTMRVNEVIVRHLKSGEDRILRSAAAPIRVDGRIAGAVAVNTDITDLKRAERDRSFLLEREQAARAQAEAAVRTREDFLSVAAHELKTPVTSMRGYAQLLLSLFSRDRPIDSESLSRALITINQQSEKLTLLIDQLLDISRIDAGRLVLNYERTSVGGLARDIVSALQMVTRQHTLVVAVSGDTDAIVDPLRVEQVITNLLSNAIKFSPPESLVRLDVDRPDMATVRIRVTDHGIGVSPEHRSMIFERFYQAHGIGFGGGMGLGLSISRQIVELHGGELYATFPPQGGTRMVALLPIVPLSDQSDG